MKTVSFFVCLSGLLFVGCSTGVVPAGPDTYFISHSLYIGATPGSGKAEIYQEANAWCTARGLVMVPVSTDEQPYDGRHRGSAELTFRALKPGDPEIKRVTIEQPDSVNRVQIR